MKESVRLAEGTARLLVPAVRDGERASWTPEWLETFDGAVVVLAVNWRGGIDELTEESAMPPYKMDLTVDMSIANHEGRWPRARFNNLG
jgi:hypothetical protein